MRAPPSTCAACSVSHDVPPLNVGHEDYGRVAKALAYMHAHFDAPLRIPELARRVGLSEDRFERLVRRVCHVTPKQFLLKVRFEEAVQLLRDPARSVAEVAHACGYSDHSAFTRKFREVTGLSPQAYRARGAAAAGP